MTANSDSCNVDAAIMKFLMESLDRVGCCTSVMFLLLAKFLRNMSDLFLIILLNDYLVWAKAYLHTKWHLDPSRRLATIDIRYDTIRFIVTYLQLNS